MARRVNPETLLTRFLRERLDGGGVYTVKLSDHFTRGIPDLLVVADRIVLVEMKIDRSTSPREALRANELGLTAMQDHRIREVCRRVARGACVVTGNSNGSGVRAWYPSTQNWYRMVAHGPEGVIAWLSKP